MAEGRAAPVRRHYSKDLRERVIYQRFTLGMSTTEIAKNLDMSLRVVQRVLKLWDEVGEVVRDPKAYAKLGRARLLDTRGIEVRNAISFL